jgi:hypothetical protein
MKRTPCEQIIWDVLPVIRKAFAEIMISKYKLSQRKVAKHLGVTPSAISQYLSDKRAKNIILGPIILKEIEESVHRILISDSTDNVPIEACKICKIFQKEKILITEFNQL